MTYHFFLNQFFFSNKILIVASSLVNLLKLCADMRIGRDERRDGSKRKLPLFGFAHSSGQKDTYSYTICRLSLTTSAYMGKRKEMPHALKVREGTI